MVISSINVNDKIFIAGHLGLVGSAIVERLAAHGYRKIITRSRAELNLLEQSMVYKFLESEKPDVVFIAAAKVGGIHANNSYRADFIAENLQIQNNLIWGSHLAGVRRLVFLGSSCIYPRDSHQPIAEEYLLTGELEYTNRPYAISKIAGLELVNSIRQQFNRDWFSVMPTNLYGPNDNFHPLNSHVLPGLMRRIHEAKSLNLTKAVIWGTGSVRREFMFSLDCADSIIRLAESSALDTLFKTEFGGKWSHINVGVGEDITIEELAIQIAEVVGFHGALDFDTSKPDGPKRKLLDISRFRSICHQDNTSLKEGLKQTLNYFKNLV